MNYIDVNNVTLQTAKMTREELIGKNILDIGCSQGITSITLGKIGKTVLGIDISEKAITDAKRQLNKENKSVKQKVKFLCTDFFTYSSSETKYELDANSIVYYKNKH